MEVASESIMLVMISSSEESRLPRVLSCSPSKSSQRMVWQVPIVRPYLAARVISFALIESPNVSVMVYARALLIKS